MNHSDAVQPVLMDVSDLQVNFKSNLEPLEAVRGVSFILRRGETLAVLGESGSGKSVTALALMGLLGEDARVSGQVLFEGVDLLSISESDWRQYRGQRIAMIFQDALSALNPVQTVGTQIGEAFRVHRGMSDADARRSSIAMMERVAIPAAKSRVNDYPHQFSGGMRQRIMIAIAIALDPVLLIADEPTSALDTTVQAQIMRLLRDLQDQTGMALMLITHDLGLGADIADRMAVMYGGRLVEVGSSADVYLAPNHPYTRALIRSAPRFAQKDKRLSAITGTPPVLTKMPTGCAFHPRCPMAIVRCSQEIPRLRTIRPSVLVACHLAEKLVTDDR